MRACVICRHGFHVGQYIFFIVFAGWSLCGRVLRRRMRGVFCVDGWAGWYDAAGVLATRVSMDVTAAPFMLKGWDECVRYMQASVWGVVVAGMIGIVMLDALVPRQHRKKE